MPSPTPRLPAFPPGFTYQRDFLTLVEESELLREIAGLELTPATYHEYTAQRKTVCFGLGISFGGTLAAPDHRLGSRPAAPGFLRYLVEKVARELRRDPRDFPHVLVTEYPPGAPIGWHRDAPPFAAIYGISLGSDCTFRLRPHHEHLRTRESQVKFTAERRSLYAMTGLSRSAWQHSIPPVKETRYSITLRTMR